MKRILNRSIKWILMFITRMIEVILVLVVVIPIILSIVEFVLERKSDKQTEYHDGIEALEIEVLNEYVYFVAPRYDEDGLMVCDIFFRKDFMRNANNYSYSEEEVAYKIEEIVLEYLGTSGEDIESIMLSQPHNYLFGRPNFSTVVWSIEIQDDKIYVNENYSDS